MSYTPDLFQDASPPIPVVPFGKLKGRPYEALLADPAYAKYLLTSKYAELERNEPALFSFLVARFGMPDATPAHNALQNRFLDPSFALRFALAANPHLVASVDALRCIDIPEIWRQYVKRKFERFLEARRLELRPLMIKHVVLALDELVKELMTQVSRVAVRNYQGTVCCNELLNPVRACVHQFEHKNVDIVYSVESGGDIVILEDQADDTQIAHLLGNVLHGKGPLRVEVKPIVGDDYPNVLRQMKSLRETQLLVAEFTATTTSWDEFLKVFSMSGIQVIHLDAVEKTEIPIQCSSIPILQMDPAQGEGLINEAFEGVKQFMEAKVQEVSAAKAVVAKQ